MPGQYYLIPESDERYTCSKCGEEHDPVYVIWIVPSPLNHDEGPALVCLDCVSIEWLRDATCLGRKEDGHHAA